MVIFGFQYQVDVTRTGATLPKNFISKESLENLNSQLAPAMGGTISMAYNTETKEFDFTFTKNAGVTAIAASTSAVSLQDGMMYTHAPSANTTYTLPAVTDSTQPHDIVIDLMTTDGKTVAFKDSSAATLIPEKAIDATGGKRYRVICTWAFGAGRVAPVQFS